MNNKIALMALPWHPFDYLSLQLGTLAAYVRKFGLSIDVFHYYRDFVYYLPYGVYSSLHRGSHGEALFAALLYPERIETIKKQLLPNLPSGILFSDVIESTQRYIDDIVNNQDWTVYKAVGFTLSHEQLMCSINIARRIKKKNPKTLVFVGGALVLSDRLENLLHTFPEIDFVVYGEGEETLKEIVENLNSLPEIKGIAYRRNSSIEITPKRNLFNNLDELPYPDFTDFFKNELYADSSKVLPRICFEISRGCSWGKCHFCNLSHQWGKTVRKKTVQRIVEELTYLIKKYRSHRILICDTNVSSWKEEFAAIASMNIDLEIFAEVSGHLTRENFDIMRAAGVKSIQVGIESFSDHLLESYNKGTTVMRNIEMLKWSSELDINIGYNLIINYPNEHKVDVEQTLITMKYAIYYSPPNLINFSLSYGSNAFLDPEKHNVKGYSIPQYYIDIYPSDVISKVAPLLILWVIPETKNVLDTNWDEVERYIQEWQKKWHTNPFLKRLTWYDCHDFIIVNEYPDLDLPARSWRLIGLHCKIYSFCDREAKSIEEISCHLMESKEKVCAAVEELYNMGILFLHKNKVLSLGIKDA